MKTSVGVVSERFMEAGRRKGRENESRTEADSEGETEHLQMAISILLHMYSQVMSAW